jgi:hypothetical protein
VTTRGDGGIKQAKREKRALSSLIPTTHGNFSWFLNTVEIQNNTLHTKK